MNVLIFGAVRSFDEFHQILTNISSAGVVVISVHLQNKQQDFDYIQDLLRVAFDMYHENDNIHSHFYHKLSGSTVIAGFGEMADRIIWMHHPQNFVHSSIKGVISLSPSLWRDSNLLHIARNMQTNILLIAGSTDAWRPISHQRPIFNEIPSGKSRHNGVCKTYVQLQGGNHCYFIDYEPTQQTVTHCYQQEMKYGSYQSSSMSHEYQLRTYSARLILEFVTFISNPSNESANAFQSYLRNVRDTTGDIEYLQSCYVDDLFFAHDRYFPRYQHLPEYRTVV